MKKSLIVLTALTGLLMVGCSSNRGSADNQPQDSSYSAGPVRGPGTGGMGGTSPNPGGDNSGTNHSDIDTAPAPENETTPDTTPSTPSTPDTAPSPPDNNSQSPQ